MDNKHAFTHFLAYRLLLFVFLCKINSALVVNWIVVLWNIGSTASGCLNWLIPLDVRVFPGTRLVTG